MSRWSPAGTRDTVEIAAILAHRADRAIRHFTERARSGVAKTCPICGYTGPFSAVRHKPAIWCPQCDSRPRHRLLKLWMDREMTLPDHAEVVHFAAEPWVRAEMDARGAHYRTADLNDQFELQLDITALDLPDRSVDMLMANHVLEHVDDARALAEIYRVLKPGGQAVLTVPMIEGFDKTYEDAAHDTPDARALYYGDPTHLRWYGRDIRDRLAGAGFGLREFTALEPDATEFALHRGEKVFICQRPQSGPMMGDDHG
ncbi:MAG: methyltransferase domain-containing protein [Pseudomonadota bacterium]